MPIEAYPSHPETIAPNHQPSIHAELMQIGAYADHNRFSDMDLTLKYRHFNALKSSGEISPRAVSDVERILASIAFEVWARNKG